MSEIRRMVAPQMQQTDLSWLPMQLGNLVAQHIYKIPEAIELDRYIKENALDNQEIKADVERSVMNMVQDEESAKALSTKYGVPVEQLPDVLRNKIVSPKNNEDNAAYTSRLTESLIGLLEENKDVVQPETWIAAAHSAPGEVGGKSNYREYWNNSINEREINAALSLIPDADEDGLRKIETTMPKALQSPAVKQRLNEQKQFLSGVRRSMSMAYLIDSYAGRLGDEAFLAKMQQLDPDSAEFFRKLATDKNAMDKFEKEYNLNKEKHADDVALEWAKIAVDKGRLALQRTIADRDDDFRVKSSSATKDVTTESAVKFLSELNDAIASNNRTIASLESTKSRLKGSKNQEKIDEINASISSLKTDNKRLDNYRTEIEAFIGMELTTGKQIARPPVAQTADPTSYQQRVIGAANALQGK